MSSCYGILDVFRELLYSGSHNEEGRSAVYLFQFIHERAIHLYIRSVVEGQCHHRLRRIDIPSSGEDHPFRIGFSLPGGFRGLFRTLFRLFRAALYRDFRFRLLLFPALSNETGSKRKGLKNNKQHEDKHKSKKNPRLSGFRFSFLSCSSTHQKTLFFFRKRTLSFCSILSGVCTPANLTTISKLSLSASRFMLICHE